MIRFEADFDKFIRKIEKMEKAVPVEIEKGLGKLGLKFIARAKRLTPRLASRPPKVNSVVTGQLKRSYECSRAFRRGKTFYVIVSNNTEYAQHVEWGHRIKTKDGRVVGFVPGFHMMKQAAEMKLRPELRKMVRTVMSKK